MRTMLIPILLCSLAQFAIAQPPDVFLPEGCDSVYKCFAPQSCESGSTLLTASEISKITINRKIIKTCLALIKFHAYKKYWLHVAIDSLDPTTTSVQFIQKNVAGQIKNHFKCKLNSQNKWEGYHNDKPMKSVAKEGSLNKCEFEVRLGTSEDVLKRDSQDTAIFRIDEDDSKITDQRSQPDLALDEHCDPSNLYFDKNEHSDTEVYTEVKYKPENFFCENPKISTLKYRANTGNYIASKDNILTCSGSAFVDVAGSPAVGVHLDARCSADAKYFCKDQPLYKNNGEKLVFLRPDKTIPNVASLKCPDGYPHLFIKGKPVFKEGTRTAPDIECINYGKTQQWTVNRMRLTSQGPEAYCSNKLVCKDLYKIQQSSVLRGTLDTNGFPSCFAGGTLHEQSGGEAVPSNFRCDESTGEFKYDLGGVAKKVEGVKFECKYPAPFDVVAKDKDNQKKLAFGVIGSAIGVGALVIVLIFGGIWFARWSYRREQKRRAAADKAAYEEYALGKAEKAKLKAQRMKEREEAKKNNKAAPSSDDEKVKQKTWAPVFLAHMTDNTADMGNDLGGAILIERASYRAHDEKSPSEGIENQEYKRRKEFKEYKKDEWKMVNGTYDQKYHKEEPTGWQEKK